MRDLRQQMVSQTPSGIHESDALVAHLQAIREAERIALARELHDDLGGVLVSAVMDLGFAEQQLSSGVGVPEVLDVLTRARASLRAAIDLKRDMTERLRPSLLDNFGLFAALHWHVKICCTRAHATCTERYPDEELRLLPDALTGLFRISQDLLQLAVSEMSRGMNSPASVEVRVWVIDGELRVRISNSRIGAQAVDVASLGRLRLEVVCQRVRALRGDFHIEYGDTEIAFEIHTPLWEILAAA